MCPMKTPHTKFQTSLLLLILVAVSGLQASCSKAPAEHAVSTGEPAHAEMAIRAGDRATEEDPVTPSTAMIFQRGVKEWFSSCSGTLIAPNVVLTAGHCVTAADSTRLRFEHLFVTFGVDPLEEPTLRPHRILAARLHPGFKAPRNGSYADMEDVNDIAIILIEGRAPKDHRPASFADSRFELSRGLRVIVAGYGAPDEFDMSNRLRFLPSDVIGPRPLSGQLLAKPIYAESSTTMGDSGGPVFVETPQGLLLVGVHSGVMWDRSSIFESVPRHAAWIRAATRELLALNSPPRTPPAPGRPADSTPSKAR
jgi:hypothetical protein